MNKESQNKRNKRKTQKSANIGMPWFSIAEHFPFFLPSNKNFDEIDICYEAFSGQLRLCIATSLSSEHI